MLIDDVPEPRLLSYYLAQGLCMGSLGSVITLLGDLRDEFGLSETQLGLIVGAGFFTAFVTQITLGRVADRGHAPLMVRIGLVAAGASMIGFAASSGFWAGRGHGGAGGRSTTAPTSQQGVTSIRSTPSFAH